MMLALIAGLVLSDGSITHTFRYQAERDHQAVYLAGSFNNWDRRANPMRRTDGKLWTLEMRLQPGKHQYKFVLDGEEWITDPLAARNEDDGNGNINSILMILPEDYKAPAVRGDGTIAQSALRHETQPPDFNYDRGRLSFSLRTRAGDVEGVNLVVNSERRPMRLTSEEDLYEMYRVSVPWDRQRDLSYWFEILDGGKHGFGADGLSHGGEEVKPLAVKAAEFKPFKVPDWAERTVVYQIFPDRFANGNPKNDPKDVVPWTAEPTWFNRYGGDIAGILQRARHLEELGIGAIYFNPIFQSPSNHRYETSDYFLIDRELGSNDEFAHMTRYLSDRGIKTILDGVFNHTAVDFKPFADIRERGEASPYVNWYFIHSFPVKVGENPNYEAWWGFPSMPKVNLEHPEAKQFMLDVPGWWHRNAQIHGWRLDVANEVPMSFWRDFRQTVKRDGEDKWIIGEVWSDGSPWLKGDQWDSIMGYQFRDAAIRFVAEEQIGPTEFARRLMHVHESYAPQVSRNLMILLSSHDTPRFLTLCQGDQQLARLAATLQLTWVGAPSIYYGEEVGMEGGPDPENRRGMRWDLATADNPMLKHYRALIKARNGSRALQSGDPHILHTDDAKGTLAYARVMDDESAIVAVNRSRQAQTISIPVKDIPVPPRLRDALTGRTFSISADGTWTVSLAALESVVLLPAPSTSFADAALRRSASTASSFLRSLR
jgi:cyclomaltodextrinase / maltogenic alpha-amylase / neopullulanase